MSPHDQHIKAILGHFQRASQRHDRYTLFSDCIEMIALSISNAVDARAFERREARYLEIAARYDRPTLELFPCILAEITMALETGPTDVLGEVFGALGIHNSDRGQFFTPYTVCQMMARVTLGDAETARARMAEKGFVEALEPACGAGAMVIALAEAMRAEGINYQRQLHVTAIDIDPRAVHMAYIQFSLLHVPAEVVVGDSLALEVRDRWFTPAHILGGWGARTLLARSRHAESNAAASSAKDKRSDPGGGAAPPPEPGVQLSLF